MKRDLGNATTVVIPSWTGQCPNKPTRAELVKKSWNSRYDFWTLDVNSLSHIVGYHRRSSSEVKQHVPGYHVWLGATDFSPLPVALSDVYNNNREAEEVTIADSDEETLDIRTTHKANEDEPLAPLSSQQLRGDPDQVVAEQGSHVHQNVLHRKLSPARTCQAPKKFLKDPSPLD